MDLDQCFATHESRLIERFAHGLHGRTALVIDAWPTRPLPVLPLPEVLVLPPLCWPDGCRGTTSRAWPYATGGVDVVLWRHAHECWPLPESLLAETDRVLGPDGLLLIVGFRLLGGRLCHLVDPGLRFPPRTPRGVGAGLTRLGFEKQRAPARTASGRGWGLPLLTAELRSRMPPGFLLNPAGRDWPHLSPNRLSWPLRRVA